MSVISLEHVGYRYPLGREDAVRDVSFQVEQGQVCALLGANGSGKTTICNLIRGFIPRFYRGEPTGLVQLAGRPVEQYDDAELTETVGYSFQNPFTQMSGVKDNVREEIAYALENLGIERDAMAARVDDMIELLHLGDIADANPLELSGGQRQRVAIAAVLVTDPPIVVLDEPTSQLDPQSTEDVFNIIALLKRQGKTVILVEHKIDLVARYSDLVILMEDGRVAMSGPACRVLTDPQVLDHGGQLPEVTRFFLERNQKLGLNDPVPLSVEDAIERYGREGV
ncbi:ABC transporter ATP-binding protein [Bifidobacterium sp. W8101]|uniref:energy-coupling factor ABC transporter ATP-binding protein n=1 Tax=Bifidobacterium TaxID=1678 RepID=UPI0018DBFEAA|nr:MULTISPECIES: ABC transporter ATP-binding protein [Bifidobacterium]MBI0126367.1 ABC transporter ATP-binding protein [Bifidobacterium choladohabitans]MBI0127936.1 ABC transporter ATP-binding protein [Bifidobacterium sp. W8103]MBI0138524.1 ABC transporter ATP-binding protein [Bifidobacterium sp. W8105]MBI0148506.1 ABC transporter ATP-binding protein [Bifidobacterium sp. W8107]